MNKEELKIETMPVIIYVPNNSVKIEITANIIDEDNEIYEAKMVLNLPEIIEARIKGEYWEDENLTYSLTDDYKAKLEAEENG